MQSVSGILSHSIGKKFLVAITGIIWYGFVAGHMLGNMLVFVSPKAYNLYGHAIISNPLLPAIEAVLVAALLTHVVLGIKLKIANLKANPSKYALASSGSKSTKIASKTMAQTGSLILVFIITHIATFKYGTFYSINYDGQEVRDLHRLMVEVFAQPAYVAWYTVALIFLGFHLYHGVSSSFQSLGINHPKYTPIIKRIGISYAIIVALGFISQPLYVFLTR